MFYEPTTYRGQQTLELKMFKRLNIVEIRRVVVFWILFTEKVEEIEGTIKARNITFCLN